MIKKKSVFLPLLLVLFASYQFYGISHIHKKNVKAPYFMQKYINNCIKSQHRTYSICDFLKRLIIRFFGFSTVYIGPPTQVPDLFADDNDIVAFTIGRVGMQGIYLNPKIFKNKTSLTAKNRYTLAHESVHVSRGPIACLEQSIDWFIEEYMADKKAIDILFNNNDYEALKRAYKNIFYKFPRPFNLGTIDGIYKILKNNPDNKQLKKLIDWILSETKRCEKLAISFLENDDNSKQDIVELSENLFIFNEAITIFQDPQSKPIATLQERVEQYEKSNLYRSYANSKT